jgi:hypothetical protein
MEINAPENTTIVNTTNNALTPPSQVDPGKKLEKYQQ